MSIYDKIQEIEKDITKEIGLNKDQIKNIYNHTKIKKIINSIKVNIPNNKEYYIRLTNEFALLLYKKFAKYILDILEIMKLIEDIPHIIRGSAGSSLVCYLTKITNIDPIKENICLARFLHELRDSMPDVDFDFPYNLRDDVFNRINKNFPDKMARISNHIMFREKSALRKAIKEVDTNKTISQKSIKNFNNLKLNENLKNEIIDKKNELLNTFRCFSLHCGGIVIFNDTVPDDLLLKESKKIKQIKYNKDETEENGLFKIDILSNRGLAQLIDISKNDIELYPRDDKNVFKLLSKGNNIGITFAESPAMRKAFIEIKPESLEDIAKALAIIRPMAQDFKSEYLKKLINENKIHNYMIFDDDAIRYIKDLIKCPESKADIYRKAFTKNKYKEMNIFKTLLDDFLNIEEDKKFVMNRLSNLSKYSFCKSHAYSYAKLVLALAYQKTYNPKLFWVSTLNHCHTMYRKWVHFQCAKSHVKLTLGKRPWKLVNDILVSENKNNDPISDLNKVEQYKLYGYWITDDYLIDSYMNFEFIENNLLLVKFKGLIGCGRYYQNKITFLTIGYKKDKFVDVIIDGKCFYTYYDYIEGEGTIKNPKDKIYKSSINVTNYKLYKIN
jgi:DNA polymerase III alpha subunit